MKSEQCGFVDRIALSEAAQAELVRVSDLGATVQDQIGKDFPRRRRMHHAVSAEAVGEKKSRHFGNRSKDGVVVGGHLVKSGPTALRINGKILEARHAVSGARQHLFDECGIEVGVVSRSVLLWIVPRQQESKRFRPEVETV